MAGCVSKQTYGGWWRRRQMNEVEVKLVHFHHLPVRPETKRTCRLNLPLTFADLYTAPYVTIPEQEVAHQLIGNVLRRSFVPKASWNFMVIISAERGLCKSRLLLRAELANSLLELDPGVKLKVVLNFNSRQNEGFPPYAKQLAAANHNLRATIILKATGSGPHQFKGDLDDARFFRLILEWRSPLFGDVSLSYISRPSFDSPFTGSPKLNSKEMAISKGISKETFTDDVVVLVTKSGSRIPCRKNILLAHSDIWQTLLDKPCGASNKNTLILEEMDDDGVRALLEYLYCWELRMAEDKCAVAIQLFGAGQRYYIPHLTKAMKAVLVCQRHDWFELEDVVKLYTVVAGEGNDVELIEKIIDVIKMKKDEVKRSPCFRAFFRSSPDLALKLFSQIL